MAVDTALAEAICERLAAGESLRAICRDPAMPARATVFRWLLRDEGFAAQYRLAREAQAEAIFDEMLEIADDGTNDHVAKLGKDGEVTGWAENGEALRRSALRIETRKWVLARLRPRKYGDRLAHVGADGDGPVQVVISAADAGLG